MNYTVAKRFGQELLDVREFVRPGTYMVGELVTRQNFARPEDAWAWVLANIKYPWGPIDRQDRHVMMAYLEPRTRRARYVYETDDYWEMPSEALRDLTSDCDGRTFLLASILRRAWPNLAAYATVGYYEGYGHMWVAVWQNGWRVMETTLDGPPASMSPEGPPYRPLFRFDEREVLVGRWEVPAKIKDREKTAKINTAYNLLRQRR